MSPQGEAGAPLVKTQLLGEPRWLQPPLPRVCCHSPPGATVSAQALQHCETLRFMRGQISRARSPAPLFRSHLGD